MYELRPYQKEAIQKIASKNGKLLVNAPTGSGKTVIALYLRKKFPTLKKVLIVCPASVKLQWNQVIKETFPQDTSFVVQGSYKPSYAEKILDSDFVVINYDILFSRNADRSWTDILKKASFTLMVLDESHNLSNKDSNRSKCVFELALNIPYKVMLTATPITNNISGLWGQLRILDPLQFPSVTSFLNYYAPPVPQTIYRKGGGGRKIKIWKPGKIQHLTELQALVQNYCYIISAEEVYKHLAGVQRTDIPCVVEDKGVQELVSRLRKHPIKTTADERKAKELLASTRMELGKAKIDAGVAWLNDWLTSTEEKIVVFAYHREVVEKTVEKLGKCAVKFYGGMSSKEKASAVDSFINNPSVRVIVMNMNACTGVDGLQIARTCFYIENTSLASLYQQSEGRIRRTNSKYDAYFAYRLVADILDPQILAVMQSRWAMSESIMNGKEAVVDDSADMEVIKQLQKGVKE